MSEEFKRISEILPGLELPTVFNAQPRAGKRPRAIVTHHRQRLIEAATREN